MIADPFEGTPYRTLDLIGHGGMGTVFKVEHRELGAKFAAKLLHAWLAQHPQVVDRVRLEAQTLGRLAHPNIVSITTFAQTTDGRPYLVMELLRGRSLAAECEYSGAMPVFGAVFFARQLLRGLGAAHELGVVHRDVKPNNLFLHEYDSGERTLKILDFGVARVLERLHPRSPLPLAYPTEGGALLGTPRFMSPEVITGGRIDHRADLYGAGLVLYQMLAGRDPFHYAKGEELLLSAHAVEDPQPPSEAANQTIPPALDRIVLKALAKRPADRFQSASEFEAALAELAGTLESPSDWAQSTGLEAVNQSGPTPPAIGGGVPGPTLTLGIPGTAPAPSEPREMPVASTSTETLAPETPPAKPRCAVESIAGTAKSNLESRWFLALVFIVAAIVAGLGMAVLE